MAGRILHPQLIYHMITFYQWLETSNPLDYETYKQARHVAGIRREVGPEDRKYGKNLYPDQSQAAKATRIKYSQERRDARNANISGNI